LAEVLAKEERKRLVAAATAALAAGAAASWRAQPGLAGLERLTKATMVDPGTAILQ
jgi:hypothetical protein